MVKYWAQETAFTLFDARADTTLRVRSKPKVVMVEGKPLPQISKDSVEGWNWKPLADGGLLSVHQVNGRNTVISF
jgi:hypothetical protein